MTCWKANQKIASECENPRKKRNLKRQKTTNHSLPPTRLRRLLWTLRKLYKKNCALSGTDLCIRSTFNWSSVLFKLIWVNVPVTCWKTGVFVSVFPDPPAIPKLNLPQVGELSATDNLLNPFHALREVTAQTPPNMILDIFLAPTKSVKEMRSPKVSPFSRTPSPKSRSPKIRPSSRRSGSSRVKSYQISSLS